MPLNQKYLAKFQEEQPIHIVCKTIAKRPLFLSDDNKAFFLKRYKDFLYPFVKTYAYNLLHNHVHIIIKPRTATAISSFLLANSKNLTKTHKKYLSGDCPFHELIEQQFHRLFISYTLAFNKQQNISSHLFNRPFKRNFIEDDSHFTQACIYVHANNVHHGFQNDFTKYKWSSYNDIIGHHKTFIEREEMLDWFGGVKNFIDLHEAMAAYFYEGKYEPL